MVTDVDNPDEDRAPADDAITQRAYAFLEIALNFEEVPESARDELRAFMGALTRSINPGEATATVSRMRRVQS